MELILGLNMYFVILANICADLGKSALNVMYFLCLILYYYKIYITVMLNVGVVLCY